MAREERESEVPGPLSIEPGSADILLRAAVQPYALGALLLQIAERKLTGQLQLHSDMGRRTIFFHSGYPVFGESSLFGERLGALGVRHGLLRRDDVARGLALAREHGCGLGQALLELDRVDTPGLFALLAVQLREVVAASCGPEPLRARFLSSRAALRSVVVLRLHPLTAVLTAVQALPLEDQRGLLAMVGERRVHAALLPQLAQQWLTDLGYLGELDRLATGEPTVATLRARLVARQRAGAERAFDPTLVPFSLPGPREGTPTATPAIVADLVMLSLLLSGALRLSGAAAPTNGSRDSTPPLQLALAEAIDQPAIEIREIDLRAHSSPTEAAVAEYLWATRDRGLAAGEAVWGPSVEALDPSVPAPVLTLYLTLKPEKRAVIVLDVDSTASSEWISEQYARRLELLASLETNDASPHLLCRAAELAQCFDDALEKLLPGSVSRPLSPPPPAVPPPAAAPVPARRTSERPQRESSPATRNARALSPSIPPPAALPRTTIPPPAQSPSAAAVDALAAKVEALMRTSDWRGVQMALDAHGPTTALPFTLKLARAMAQRELEVEIQADNAAKQHKLYAALGIGFALGFGLAWLLRALLAV